MNGLEYYRKMKEKTQKFTKNKVFFNEVKIFIDFIALEINKINKNRDL